MKCPHCKVDLGKQPSITAIKGELLCNQCAMTYFDTDTLSDYGEQVCPDDIGIY